MRRITLFISLMVVLTWAQDVNFTALPKPMQFFARDTFDSASVAVAGSVITAGHDSISLTVLKNGAFWKRSAFALVYGNGSAPFSVSVNLHAELSEYRITVKLDTLTTAVSDSIVCGDAFIIEGQSNAVCAQEGYSYSSEWIRSFGSSSFPNNFVDDTLSNQADSSWGRGQGMTYSSHCAVGLWGMLIARRIVENYHVPVCIINGAVGGTSIQLHLRTPDFTNSVIYLRLYRRVQTGRTLKRYQGIILASGGKQSQ